MGYILLLFECKISPMFMCCKPAHQLVKLFRKVMEYLGGGTSLKVGAECLTGGWVPPWMEVTGKCYTIVHSRLEHPSVLGSSGNWEPIPCACQRDDCTRSEEKLESILSKHAYSCFRSIYWNTLLLLLFTTGISASMSKILFLGFVFYSIGLSA